MLLRRRVQKGRRGEERRGGGDTRGGRGRLQAREGRRGVDRRVRGTRLERENDINIRKDPQCNNLNRGTEWVRKSLEIDNGRKILSDNQNKSWIKRQQTKI